MLPYSGEITYDQIRAEFGYPTDFSLREAYSGVHGPLNQYSYIQPNITGNANFSPTNWYGYTGDRPIGADLLSYDAWPIMGSYSGSGSSIYDMSNMGYDGILMNGSYWKPANGGSFALDGIDDFITVGSGRSQAPGPDNLRSFSVEMWFNVQDSFAIGAGAGQGSYKIDDWGGSNMWLLHPNGTMGLVTWTFYVNADPAGQYNILSATTSINLATDHWYQVVGTFGDQFTSIYVNGQLSGQGAGGGGVITNPFNTLVIGGDPRYDFRRLTGDVAVFNMYNRELRADEVLNNFNAIRGRFNI